MLNVLTGEIKYLLGPITVVEWFFMEYRTIPFKPVSVMINKIGTLSNAANPVGKCTAAFDRDTALYFVTEREFSF